MEGKAPFNVDDPKLKKQRNEQVSVPCSKNEENNRNDATINTIHVTADQEDPTVEEYGKNPSNNVERKRAREQKRRSDITNAIDLLVQVLLNIDMPFAQTAAPNNQSIPSNHCLGQSEQGSFASNTITGITRQGNQQLPYNRSEIISYAKQVLERIHQENMTLKLEVESLKAQLTAQMVRIFLPWHQWTFETHQ